jgi:hypothetical protein
MIKKIFIFIIFIILQITITNTVICNSNIETDTIPYLTSHKIISRQVIRRDTVITKGNIDTLDNTMLTRPDTITIYQIVETIIEIIKTEPIILDTISKYGELRAISTISNNKNFGLGLMFERKRFGLIFQAATNNEYSIGATYKLTN